MAPKRFPSQYIGVPVQDIPEDIIDQAAESYNYFEDENGILQSYGRSAGSYTPNDPVPEGNGVVVPETNPISISSDDALDAVGIATVKNSRLSDRQLLARGEYNQNSGEDIVTNISNTPDNGTTNRQVNTDAPENGATSTSVSRREIFGISDGKADATFVQGQRSGLFIDQGVHVTNPVDATSNNQRKPNYVQTRTTIINVQPNELNDFSQSTYSLALYMLNSQSYIDLTNAPNTPENVLADSLLLMRSGGVGSENADTEFFNDFFIDDLEMENVAVGPSKFKMNTNSVNIKFNIIEPRGVTLLEKLQNAASSVLANTGERYIHAPYLLEVKFHGIDDEGRPSVSSIGKSKYIPIRITNMTFDVSEAGTQYRVEAIPFAQELFGQITSTIPTHMEIKARTIGDIFDINSEGITLKESTRVYDDDYDNEGRIVQSTVKGETPSSVGEVLTRHMRKRTEVKTDRKLRSDGPAGRQYFEKIEISPSSEEFDEYKFRVADEIANATINHESLFDALNSPIPKESSGNNRAQADEYVRGLSSNVSLDTKTQVFKINAGTDLIKLINIVIMHSSYMDDNIVDNLTSGSGGLNWFKVRPVILEPKSFDALEGRYKYKFSFNIEPQTIHYHDFPWAKQSIPDGDGVHKVYNYIFSGENTDVLNFHLRFNTSFLQVMTAKVGNNSGAPKDPNSTFVSQVLQVPESVEGQTISSKSDIKRTKAKDLFTSVMHDGVDMVNLELDIVGDPAYLPTSDAYWQDKSRSGELYTNAYMPDGTINYDMGPPYIQVNLKTPTDYNEQTGLADPSKLTNSSFSGQYRVTSVSSSFSGGLFTQRLYGFRTRVQANISYNSDTYLENSYNDSRSSLIGDLVNAGRNLFTSNKKTAEEKPTNSVSNRKIKVNNENKITSSVPEVFQDLPRTNSLTDENNSSQTTSPTAVEDLQESTPRTYTDFIDRI